MKNVCYICATKKSGLCLWGVLNRGEREERKRDRSREKVCVGERERRRGRERKRKLIVPDHVKLLLRSL